MIANYIQTKTIEPLNSVALNQLMLQLQENQNDETLKEQIRALDLLARRAYFTNQWQIRTGGFLLFAFVLTFLLSIKYMTSLQAKMPDLEAGAEPENSWENNLLSKKYIMFSGLGLFLLAFLTGVLSETELSGVGFEEEDASTEVVVFPGIEEIRDNWPNFRGPEGIGIAYHNNVPTSWNGTTGENILWKTEIPLPGYNSPIIWERKIFLSGADRGNQVVYCFDADTGTKVWQHELNDVRGTPADKPRISNDTGFAPSTMATDGIRVFVIFVTGDVVCLDFEGNRIWAKNIGVPSNNYGHASSLIVFQDLLLVQYDQTTGGRLMALKANTGDMVYNQLRETGISWASPIVVNTGSRYEVVLNSIPGVISHDPRTGQVLWRVDCMMDEVAPSLAYADGIIFAIQDNARFVAIKIEDTPVVLWENDEDLSDVSSPVATADLVFFATGYGTLCCYDSKTGELYWYQDISGGFYSSPVLSGENVYVTDRDGTTFIFKADKEFKLVNKCELGERAVAVPAFMHDRIYIRGYENLYCIGK
ncbi:PQQ-binding-like beta-propeller repeat protein [candidate division KSB1 bacterium]